MKNLYLQGVLTECFILASAKTIRQKQKDIT